ncbi:MAG: hypothetical protein GY822_15850 [Deltaproteobacteria bacterium]|nr:hypothetical protein [Deltaproteobacteria bacterium]
MPRDVENCNGRERCFPALNQFLEACAAKNDGDRQSTVLYDEEKHIYYGFGSYN